ncbi:bacteriophage abortive infection AbiH [Kordia sp. SMS9]|uniref:AbiH family protein n=1 Tax=Kordia sp. SMS9 TaxID=2282170 RepID=UPI000E0CF197|nr:AbiH family protein [Kordia sp. SMS9]AXG69319.1 bacteriophage abortive infection AbiH [Kordia sp. SMS9]
MNKLIIAGNGFDLAHGLPTSYNHFMDAFWRDLKENQDDDLVKEVVYLDPIFQDHFDEGEILNFKDFESNIHKYLQNNLRGFEYQLEKYSFSQRGMSRSYGKEVVLFKFKNKFFKELNETQSIQNWVYVENEYYQALKSICKDEELEARQKRERVIKLHEEFEQVKQLLEIYLKQKVVETYDFNAFSEKDHPKPFNILRRFVGKESNEEKLKLASEFSDRDDEKFMFDLDPSESKKQKVVKFNSYIVNFNYTPTFVNYCGYLLLEEKQLAHINHIHGELSEENIVFGFGDEMDEDYKLIEDMDDNEYLRYFKSFQYSQNSNYKDILRYINSEKFQVIIMGHSCGLSDRVLLNTIFEHDNCRSIKVFYYQNGEYDNYTEIVQNISRHFNDKKLMRTKIVEKTLCEPMPQIQLPKKK